MSIAEGFLQGTSTPLGLQGTSLPINIIPYLEPHEDLKAHLQKYKQMAQMEAIADRKAQLMLEENSKLGFSKLSKVEGVDRLPSGGLKYRGETFPGYNKPKTAPAGSKHKKRVLAKKGDKVKVVNFGARGYKHNYSKKAKKSYLARSAGIKGKDDKFSANYWSRRVLWPSNQKADGRSKKASSIMLNPTLKRELFLELVKTAKETQPKQKEQIKQVNQETQNTATSKTEKTPEPSTWDTVKSTLGDMGTSARGMATRLLRPAVRGVQQGVNYALDNSELLRSYVPADQQAELSAALYHSTGDRGYVDNFRKRLSDKYRSGLEKNTRARVQDFIPDDTSYPSLDSYREKVLDDLSRTRKYSPEERAKSLGPAFDRYYGTGKSGIRPLSGDSYSNIYKDMASTLDTGYRKALSYLSPEQVITTNPEKVVSSLADNTVRINEPRVFSDQPQIIESLTKSQRELVDKVVENALILFQPNELKQFRKLPAVVQNSIFDEIPNEVRNIIQEDEAFQLEQAQQPDRMSRILSRIYDENRRAGFNKRLEDRRPDRMSKRLSRSAEENLRKAEEDRRAEFSKMLEDRRPDRMSKRLSRSAEENLRKAEEDRRAEFSKMLEDRRMSRRKAEEDRRAGFNKRLEDRRPKQNTKSQEALVRTITEDPHKLIEDKNIRTKFKELPTELQRSARIPEAILALINEL